MAHPVRRYVDPRESHLLSRFPAPRRGLFLDRDGVINVDHGYVHAADRTDWIPGIFALCRRALSIGFLPVVVTNQAGIARGLYTEAQFIDHTAWMHRCFAEQAAALLATFYCPHHPTAGAGDHAIPCRCRKPAPGMFESAADEFGIDLAQSLMVGNKASDMQAATDAGIGERLLLGDIPELLRSPPGVRAIVALDDVFMQSPAAGNAMETQT